MAARAGFVDSRAGRAIVVLIIAAIGLSAAIALAVRDAAQTGTGLPSAASPSPGDSRGHSSGHRSPGGSSGGQTAQLPTATTTSVAPVPRTQQVLQPRQTDTGALAHAVGFGQGAAGGAGGERYHVTSAGDSLTAPAAGTLRYALLQARPLWIVFDSDMTIQFSGPMSVAPDKTIDGRNRKVTLTGHGFAGLHIYDTHNVIVENLTFRDFGDIAKTAQNDPDDEIDIQRSSNIWIDHCTMSMAGDKLIAMEDGATRVTISWNRFFGQEQTLQIGAIATALADIGSEITIHHNFFDRTGYREPLVAYAKVHVYNNYMLGWRSSAVRSERLAQVVLERNIFRAAASRKAALITPSQRCNDSHKFCDGRAGNLYDLDNVVINKASIRSTGRSKVFTPSAAYPYTAQSPDDALQHAVSTDAGVH